MTFIPGFCYTIDMDNLYQIREISTLSFNERVLQEAEDVRNPLLERLKFLGIFSSNMDEFFKVRVASIRRRIELGKRGMPVLLEVVTQKSRELDERFRAVYTNITSGLAAGGIKILNERDLETQSPETIEWLREYFHAEVLPALVPIILHKTQAFPDLIDGSLYFAVRMTGKKTRYAVLEILGGLPRFVLLPNGNIMYIDDVIRFSLNEMFYIFEYERIEAFEFKISRDAELDMDNDFSEGYIRKMERSLLKRKGGRAVRLVYDASMPPSLLEVLLRELKISKGDPLIGGGRYHNMKDLMRFPSKRPDFMFEKREYAKHPVLDRVRTPMFDLLRKRDLLVTYPYQGFDHLIRLLREAAIDPRVQSIGMTLYRAASQSQVVNTLVNAARNGKKVTVSIELQARFDEQNNIKISERLREVGATVAYGVPPMKVHAKLLHIQREDMSVVGLSTGNFNEVTGHLYVDSLLLTTDARLVKEVADVLGILLDPSKTRILRPPKFKHLLVSPINSRKSIMKFLTREQKKGSEGYVFIKTNHLTDERIIKKIVETADAGVRMDLVVRTTYAMLPHPNIRAISILDRYLEHQRVYIFGRGDDRQVFMSSADLMERNLDWRIEVAFPIYDPELKRQVCDMMDLQIADDCKARILNETQSNPYVGDGSGKHRVQNDTYRYLEDLFAGEK
jgi:polyphosphate kinase